jgi:uncharacterized protein YukE
MGFLSDWKAAKKAFETTTGKSKPSAKFLGVFHKSGVEDVAAAMDNALAKGDQKALEAALIELGKSVQSYDQVLQKAAKEDSGSSNYKAELKKLDAALLSLSQNAGLAVNRRVTELREKAAEAQFAVVNKAHADADQGLRLINADIKALGDQEQIADEAVREIIDLKPKGKMKEAKAAGSRVVAAAKAGGQLAAKVAGTRDKIGKIFAEARKAAAKTGAADRKLQGVFDKIDAICISADDLAGQAAATAKGIAAAVKDAERALAGTLDVLGQFGASAQKLAARAGDVAMKYDAVVREMGGGADKANLDMINASETTDDPKKREDFVKSSRASVATVRRQAEQARKEIVDAGKNLTKSRDSFQPEVRKAFPKEFAQIDDYLKSLRESLDEVGKATAKVDKVEKGLDKLA